MITNIGLSSEQIQGSTAILNQVLADTFVLYVKTRKYHWNVTGKSFYELHQFFQSIYEELDDFIDDIAERSRSLMTYATGSMSEYIKTANLKEDHSHITDSTQMLENLLVDFEVTITYLRQAIDEIANTHNDAGTADFLTAIMEKHEKTAWMLWSFLA